ncbi:hypothetical protein J4450_04665 [Candidatus Micrarchaeota archaeon]|nr:hypothetical protein [Candidatus Micrarchaeota archaeon]
MQITRSQAIEMLKHVLPLKPMPDALIKLLKIPEKVNVGNTPYLTLYGEKADEKIGMENDPFYSAKNIPAWLKSDPWYVNIRSTGMQTYFIFIDKRDGKNISVNVLVASELEGSMKKPPSWQGAINAIKT